MSGIEHRTERAYHVLAAKPGLTDWSKDEKLRLAREIVEAVGRIQPSNTQGAVEALREIGAPGGPLYLLEPNQGERPDPLAAALRLREILDRYWGQSTHG